VRGFLLNDREQMYALAEAYDPDMPPHENPEYVEKTRKYLDRDAQAMQGNAAAFGSRLDRGWVPPTLDDVEAESEAAAEENADDTAT
jgi:CPA2 family monovalent cation:H+ antiporter-2